MATDHGLIKIIIRIWLRCEHCVSNVDDNIVITTAHGGSFVHRSRFNWIEDRCIASLAIYSLHFVKFQRRLHSKHQNNNFHLFFFRCS